MLGLILLTVPVKSVHAETLWLADIEVTINTETANLIIGADPAATDYHDSRYDASIVFTASDRIRAYFYHPEWGVSNAYFWADIHDTITPDIWIFEVVGLYINMDYVVGWDLTNVPANLSFTLVDEFTSPETVIDMRSATSYTYFNSLSSARSFRVEVTAQ